MPCYINQKKSIVFKGLEFSKAEGTREVIRFWQNSFFEKSFFFFLSKMSPSIYRMGSVKRFIFLFSEVSKRFNQMLSKHFSFSLITHTLQAYFFFLFKIFIYLASPGLSCGKWDLPSWPWKEPVPPALWAWSLCHWTPGKVFWKPA